MEKKQNICRASIPNKWDFTHRLPDLSFRDFRKASDTIGDMNLRPMRSIWMERGQFSV